MVPFFRTTREDLRWRASKHSYLRSPSPKLDSTMTSIYSQILSCNGPPWDSSRSKTHTASPSPALWMRVQLSVRPFHPPYTRNSWAGRNQRCFCVYLILGARGARFDKGLPRRGVEEPVRRRHGTATLVELVPFAQDVGADMCISRVIHAARIIRT